MTIAQTDQRPARGFSIPEMLAVIAIIVIIISLLMPSLAQSRRTAWVAVCAANEHSIHQAFINYRNDGKVSNGRAAEVAAGAWPLTLLEYFGNESSIATCPEDQTGDEGDANGFTGGFFVKGTGNRNYDMQDGPLHRKLSLTQYENIQATYGDGDGSWRPYFQPGGGYAADGGYKDDGKNVLFLVTEDNVNAQGLPSGDQDFNDIQIKIEFYPDGGTLVSAKKASSGRYWVTFGENRELLFEDQNGGELGWSWYGPLALTSGTASYGMNRYANGLEGGKLMLLDYVKTSANPESDNWNWFRDDADNLKFARHVNRRINTLNRDGAVQQADPEDLDPTFTQVRNERWLP